MSLQQKTNAYAPIALFTFKRPDHTRRTLESLADNPEFLDSQLFIYCDGARNDVEADQVEEARRLVREWLHPNKAIIERDRNWGLANSVIAGLICWVSPGLYRECELNPIEESWQDRSLDINERINEI